MVSNRGTKKGTDLRVSAATSLVTPTKSHCNENFISTSIENYSHGHAGYIARRLLAVYQLVRTKHDELHICCAIGLVCFCPGQDVVRLEKILEHTQNKSETALSSEFAG